MCNFTRKSVQFSGGKNNIQISASPGGYGELGNFTFSTAVRNKNGTERKQAVSSVAGEIKKTNSKAAYVGTKSPAAAVSPFKVSYSLANAGMVFYTADGVAPDTNTTVTFTVTGVDKPSDIGTGSVVIKGNQPKLIILQPTANSSDEHITHEPKMPTVSCKAQLQNSNGGSVTYDCMYATADTFLQKTSKGTPLPPRYSGIGFFGNTSETRSNVSQWQVPFNGLFTGGKTLLIVNAITSEEKTYSETVYANSIIGDNPVNSAEVKARLSLEDQVLVYMESKPKWKQFNEGTINEYNKKGNPIYGPPHGFGLMQLDNPPASEAELWNWKDNLAAGTSLFAQKESGAAGYANRVKSGKTWYQDSSKGWHASDPVPFSWYGEDSPTGRYIRQIAYPNARDLQQGEELLKEAFQRYNGGAYWRWIPTIAGNSNGVGRWTKGTSSPYGDNAWNVYQDVSNGNPPGDWN